MSDAKEKDVADSDLALFADVSDDDLALFGDMGGAEGVATQNAGKALEVLGKALDWTSGMTRTAAADALGGVAGKPDVVTADDWKAAVQGMAPAGDEYLGRAGMEAGPGRSALGFGIDVLADVPVLGWASKIKKLPTAARAAFAPTSKLLEAIGEKVYKSAFKNIDKELVVDYGKKPLSDVLWENGRPVGGFEGLQSKAQDLASRLLDRRKELYDAMNKAGVRVDMDEAVGPAKALMTHIADQPWHETGGVLDELADKVSAYGRRGKIPVDVASDHASFLTDMAGSPAYKLGARTDEEQKVAQALASGIKGDIASHGDLGSQVSAINENLGSLLQSRAPMRREIKKEITKNYFSAVDGALAGIPIAQSRMGDPTMGLSILAMKKAADLSKMPGIRTGSGWLMNRFGASLLPDAIARQGLLHTPAVQEKISPWKLIDPSVMEEEQ